MLNYQSGLPFSVSTEQGHIRCRIDGVEGAPWVLFSNSHATNLSMWDGQVDYLKQHFRIVRYDQRGHGGSEAPQSVSFDSLATDIADLIKALNLENVSLVGVSMGAVTVMRTAALFPANIKRVVACDGQWSSPATASALWEERIQRAIKEGMGPLALETVNRWFPPSAHDHLPETLEHMRTMVADTPVTGYVVCARAMQRYDFRDDYRRMTIPVHFVVGECDGKLPETMMSMHEATPGSTYSIVKGAGHLPGIDQADAYNKLLMRFLSA